MTKTFHELLNEHKTKEASKLTEAQKKYRDFEAESTVEEFLRRNKSASAEYIQEIAVKLFAESEKRGGKN